MSTPNNEGTYGQAINEAYDTKTQRLKADDHNAPYTLCFGCKYPRHRHRMDCPHITMEDMRWHAEYYKRRAEWANNKAITWLNALRGMHGKLAALKAEVKILRKRQLPKVSSDPQKNWDNDAIQFPRLIAEAEAVGLFDMNDERTDLLRAEMDIKTRELMDILSRAAVTWDRIKEKTR